MDLVEHGFELFLKVFVFGALVELADKMPADLEGVIGEIQG